MLGAEHSFQKQNIPYRITAKQYQLKGMLLVTAPALGVERNWKSNMVCVKREGGEMMDWFEEVEDWMLYGPLAEEEAESKWEQKKREKEEDSDDDIA